MNRLWILLAACFAVLVALFLWLDRARFVNAFDAFSEKPAVPKPVSGWVEQGDLPEGAEPVNAHLNHLLRRLFQPGAIAYEGILTFSSQDAYDAFLRDHGKLEILGKLPALKSVRFGFDRVADLAAIKDGDLAPNYLVQLPPPPDPQGGIQDGAVPFQGNPLQWLGIDGDHSTWGEGIKIAVIDTGISAHSTFTSDQILLSRDFVNAEGEVSEINGHATPVASLAVGQHPAAPGIAPAASLLDYRVADSDGNSDSFTLAEGIMAAVDDGADIINVSMGSFGDSSVVRQAVAYAKEAGAVIVAAAGNNGIDELTFPGAYEGVISVGSVDATGQHLDFSNTSETLSLSAPGYGITAAWPDEQVIQFTGTSASAPVVSGSLAAIMSLDPGMTGQQAYEVLTAYANEAGAPGVDSVYGAGIIDMGRVLDRNTPGIYDVAVASHYYAGDVQNNGREILQIQVQNMGTEVVQGSLLTVVSSSGPADYALPSLEPGEVVTREIIVDSRLAELAGSVSYGSTVALPPTFTDGNLFDNQLSSIFRHPSAMPTPEVPSDPDN